MTSTALSETAVNKIKALRQEHIQNHYRKITSFWRKSIIVDVIFSSLILIFTTTLFIGIILSFIANNNDPCTYILFNILTFTSVSNNNYCLYVD